MISAVPSVRVRRTSSILVGLVLVGASLALPSIASADPASGPGEVTRSTAGALAAGLVPAGTCAARVTAVGGGGASSPVSAGFGGTGGAGASITATFDVLPGQSFQGSVGGGGALPAGGSGNGAVGTGGSGGSIVTGHQGGGGGGRTSVDLGGSTVVIAGGGGGGGAAHQVAPAGVGGAGGIAGIAAGAVATGSNGQTGVDGGNTANGGTGGQVAAGGAGGVNTGSAAQDGTAGGGIGVGTGGDGGPDPNLDSGAGGGGGYTGGGGGASTVNSSVSGAGGGGGSSWLSASSPTGAGAPPPTGIAGVAGPASPVNAAPGATGSIHIDWQPCLYTLTVNKSVLVPALLAGAATTWSITITNTGPDAMTQGDTVSLTDLLPAGPNGGPGPSFEVLTFNVAGGANAELSRGPVTCSGLSVGASMPASTTCSRAYSAPGAPEAPAGGTRGLDPGESITITYRQILANTAPCGTLTNTATVHDRGTTSGTTDVVGVEGTKSDSASLNVLCYDLAITKVASPTPVRAGRDITWTVTVTNNGPADMEGPVSTDPNPLVVTDAFPTTNVGAATLASATGPAGACNLVGSTITCAAGLPSGGQEVLTFTQPVDAGAVGGAVIANTASVSDPATGDTDDSSTDQTTVGVPGLSIAKSALPVSYAAVGDVIAYSFVVTNTGNIALAGPITVSDDRATDESCPATVSLAPAATVTCTASYTITQADLDAGSVTNTATASADGVTSAPDSATVTAAQGPALVLAKTATPLTYGAVGDVISYTYLVTNSGNITLSGPFTVSDDKATDESCPVTASLDPGDSITCTASYTITQADLDAGSVTNIASATNGTTTSNNDSATVTAVPAPGLTLTKTPDRTTFSKVGTVIHYQYVVTNTGNVSLAGPVVVTDNKTTVTCPSLTTIGDLDTNLDPGESVTCTSSYTVTQADVNAHRVTNTATATVGGVSSGVESATVTRGVVPPPPTSTGGTSSGQPSGALLLIVVALLGVLPVWVTIGRRRRPRGARRPW